MAILIPKPDAPPGSALGWIRMRGDPGLRGPSPLPSNRNFRRWNRALLGLTNKYASRPSEALRGMGPDLALRTSRSVRGIGSPPSRAALIRGAGSHGYRCPPRMDRMDRMDPQVLRGVSGSHGTE